MRLRAVQAGLWAVAVLATLAIGGSSANAGVDNVAVCYVPRHHPSYEETISVPKKTADYLIRHTLSYLGVCADYGESAKLGDGKLRVYAQYRGNKPDAIGVIITRDVFQDLPYEPPTQGLWCYDKDENGTIDQHHECVGGYENALHFSKKFRSKVDTPFQYMLINWNPAGHPPPHIYAVPHFDVHFYLNSNEERLAIRPGPCPVLVNCEDYEKAMKQLDPKYVAPDYSYTEAVEPGMGNHMMDMTTGEWHGEEWEHSFIYGHFDAEITFYEPMVALTYFEKVLAGKAAKECFPMKLPQAYQKSGWYPTKYCIRYRANRKEVTTSLESFVYRVAS